MKVCRTYLIGVLFGLLAASGACAQSIVGAWTTGDTAVEGASVIVFFANNTFIQIQNAKASEAPHGFDGFERGTYTWNPATGAFSSTTIQDLNGDTGFSNLNDLSGITLIVSGDSATFTRAGESLSVTRVTGASPIVGAWSFGNPAVANDSGVIVFLPNGVYFEAEDGDSTPGTGDPSGHDGIEHGTYAWNPITGLLTSSRAPAPYVDTNGEWGLSHTGTQLTFRVSSDGLTLNGTTGPADSFSLARVGAVGSAFAPVPGVWWNKDEPGSGFGLDYKDGTLLVEVYSYLAGGASQWYLAAGALTNNVFTATLDKYVNGQCVSCVYKAPSLSGNDGTITITFTSPMTATADLPGGRHISIQRFFQTAPAAGAFIPVPGVWWNKNEPGSGFGLDYENGTLLVEVYSYLAGGASQWYLAAGALTNNVFTATLGKYVNGQCVSCAYKAPSVSGNDGTITITFTSPTTATADLPGGRHIQIERFFQ